MVVLIGCGKSKQNKKCQAQNMYIGKYFKTCLDYAKTFKSDVYILSAKYGLLSLEQEIEPYDKTLNTMSKSDSLKWKDTVEKQILESGIPLDEVVFVCGKNYSKHISKMFKKCVYPLEGLTGMGHQISYMLNELKSHNKTIKKLF